MTRKKPTPRELVHDILYPGLTEDVFEARQGLSLLQTFGTHGARLDALHYGPLFGPIGLMAIRHVDLALAKVYERVSERHEVRSIPAALDTLDAHASTLQIEQRDFLERWLASKWFRPEVVTTMAPVDLTRAMVAYFRAEIPDERRAAFHAASQTLSSVRMRRNKRIAHNERIDRATLPQFRVQDAETLVAFAEDFVTVVCQSYLTLIFEFDGGERPFFSTDATQVSRALTRLVGELEGSEDADSE
jgi:hypothetical protein